jgi:hypothetical protein
VFLFVHVREVGEPVELPHRPGDALVASQPPAVPVEEGQVEFDVTQGQKGPQAENIVRRG